MLTLRDHTRYAFFRNRSLQMIFPKASSPTFFRWWQVTFCPIVVRLHADMPRHAKCFEYRHKDWRKSGTARKPVKAKRQCVRGQRMRGHFNVFLAGGRFNAHM